MEWILVKTLLSLLAVVALMVGLLLVLKKYVYAGRLGSSSTVEIKVLGQRTLQPKRSVYVLKVMNKLIVVGSSENGLQTLTEIADTESLAEVEEKLTWQQDAVAGKSAPFADHLQHYVRSFMRKRAGAGLK